MKPWTFEKWLSWKPTHRLACSTAVRRIRNGPCHIPPPESVSGNSVRWPSEAVGSVFSTASEGHRTVKTRTTNFARGFRHGVTVLEVLFSIGIVAVGLLGVLTIVPVAGNRVTQGSIADNGDRLGRTAIRQFDVGQMRRPNMWARFRTTDQTYVIFAPTVSEPAFCIDPLFVSTQVYNGAVLPQTEYFPYYAPNGAARMRRITLRNFPYSPSPPRPPNTPLSSLPLDNQGRRNQGMTLDQAYQVFMARDDLVFDLPEDRTLAPRQKFDAANAKRQFDGKYTWMATVSPKGLMYLSGAMASAPQTDLATLSIIVMYRRDMSMAMHFADPGSEGPDPERLVYADFRWNPTNPNLPPPATSTDLAPGAGIGGGSVWLKTIKHDRDGDGDPSNDLHWSQDLEVRKGDWLMLSAKVLPNNDATKAPVSVFRWYRVVSTDAIVPDPATNGPSSPNEFAREISLLGPDWTDVIGAQMFANADPVAQATLLNCVAAVYEKTIRLETSSLWTDL